LTRRFLASPAAKSPAFLLLTRFQAQLRRRSIKPLNAILGDMKVEEIAEAVARLPPDQLARFRRWFTAFEAGRTDHAEELDSAATKLGRLAGRAFADLKRRAKKQ
jgi:hypothetical protein